MLKKLSYILAILGLLVLLSLPILGIRQHLKQTKVVSTFKENQVTYQEHPEMTKYLKEQHRLRNKQHLVDPFSQELLDDNQVDNQNDVPVVTDDELKKVTSETSEVVGYITLPTINEKNLPIYIGATSDNLAKGIAQVTGTDLPLDGKGTHSVLSGHRGYYGTNFFMYLDYLQIGDIFYVTYLDQTAAYMVTGNEVITPMEAEKLIVKPPLNEEWLTLLTCHPLPYLDKRLLVHSQRVPLELTKNQTLQKVDPSEYTDQSDIQEKLVGGEVAVNLPKSQVLRRVNGLLQHSFKLYVVILVVGGMTLILLLYRLIKSFVND